MLIAFCIFLILTNALAVYVAVRFAKRTIEFDKFCSYIVAELSSYGTDLTEMMKGDLLTDHPEVLKLHSRNKHALDVISNAARSIVEVRPKVDKKALPRPEIV